MIRSYLLWKGGTQLEGYSNGDIDDAVENNFTGDPLPDLDCPDSDNAVPAKDNGTAMGNTDAEDSEEEVKTG